MFAKFFERLQDKMLWRLLRENMRAQSMRYGVSIAAMIVVAAMTALTAWIMRDVIDAMLQAGNRAQVYAVAASVTAIFAIKGAATYVQVVALSRAGNSIVATQQRKLFDRVLEHGVAFFTDRNSSELLMRVTQSADSARRVIDLIVTSVVRDFLTLVGLVFVMFYQQPLLSAISLVFGPLAIYGIRRILRRVRRIMEAELASLAEIFKVLQETSTGIRVVKAFALEKQMAGRMSDAVSAVETRANAMARLEAATSPLMETLSGIAIGAVVALSTVSVMGGRATTPGELISFITALLMAYEPAKRLARMRVSLEAGMIGVGMMYHILDTPVTITEAPDARPLPAGPGEVRFRNVSFRYTGGRQVLDRLDLTFEPGRTTALVGPSGGGKSTIINLIMRLYDPTEGSVEIDGTDLRGVTFASLRDRIAFVGQETFLFAGSVAHNIGLGRAGATQEQIEEAARAANAHDFIMSLPNGYGSNVGENGVNLSGGQRQRVAIARAILRDAPILLMDEATSALDAESEFLVQEALRHLTAGRTTIVIAHRLSTVLGADRIVAIKDGRVEEEGSAAELLKRDGLFRSLYDRQFGQTEQA